MKRNKKICALTLAGTLALSNFGMLAMPLTAFAEPFDGGTSVTATLARTAAAIGIADATARVNDVVTLDSVTTSDAGKVIDWYVKIGAGEYEKFTSETLQAAESSKVKYVIPEEAKGKTLLFKATDVALGKSETLDAASGTVDDYAAPVVTVSDLATDGETAGANGSLDCIPGKDYTATLTFDEDDTTNKFTMTGDASGAIAAGKLSFTTVPSQYADAFSLDLSKATVRKDDGATTLFQLDKVGLKVDGSKTAKFKKTDTVKILFAYEDAYGVIRNVNHEYTVSFNAQEKISDSVDIALYEENVMNLDEDAYLDGNKDGALTFYVFDPSNTVSGGTGIAVKIGSVANGIVSELATGGGFVTYDEADVEGEYYLTAESDNKAVVDVKNSNAHADEIVLLAGKNDTANVTVRLNKIGKKASKTADDVQTIGSITIPVTVTGKSKAVTIYNSKNQAITTADVTAKEPSMTVSAGITPMVSGFDTAAEVIWVSSDEDIVTVAGSGLAGTITGKGNSTAGVNVYAIASDDATYVTTYAAAIKAGDKEKAAQLKAAQAAAKASNTVLVKSSDFGLTMSATERIDLFVGGAKSSAITAKVNDKKFTQIGYDKSASQTSIKLTFESADTKIATVDNTGVVTPVAAGETTITVTGTYKVSSTSGLIDETVKATVPVTVLDAQKALEDVKAAEEKAAKAAEEKAAAETAKKAAEDKATKAAEDLKKANDAKTSAEQAATKAAEAQKAAEAKAAEAEKKAADAADATGIKKGATKAVKGQTFKATSTKAVTLTKIKNVKTVNVGSVVEINNKVYKVTALGKGALKAGKATKMTVDAQFLTKKGINKDCAKGTGKVKTLVIKNKAKKNAVSKALVTAFKKYNKNLKTVKYVN